MLMRPNSVVSKRKLIQQRSQCRSRVDGERVQLRLQRAEEPFDAAVLPGATGRRELMPDPGQGKHPAKQAALERRIVVRADRLRHTVLAHRQKEVPEQRKRIAMRTQAQREKPARAVVDEAEDGVNLAPHILLAGQVQGPDAIDRHGARYAMLDLAPGHGDVVGVPAQYVCDVGLADRNAATRVAAIERTGDATATCAGHQRPETDELRDDPGRLAPVPTGACRGNAMAAPAGGR